MPQLITTEASARQVVNTITILGGVIILGHWITDYGARGVVIEVIRGRAVEANPLATASFAGMVVICSLFAAFSTKKTIAQFLFIAFSLLALAVIVRSGSRGQLLTLILSLVLGIPAASRGTLSAKSLQLAIATLIALPIGYFFVAQYGLASRWGRDKVLDATSERWTMIEEALSAWISSAPFNFVFGSGVNASVKTFGYYCHNIIVDILYEEGVVGLFAFCAVIVTSLGPKLTSASFGNLPKGFRELICIFACLAFFEFATLLKQGNLIGSYYLFALFIILSSLTTANTDSATIHWHGYKLREPRPN